MKQVLTLCCLLISHVALSQENSIRIVHPITISRQVTEFDTSTRAGSNPESVNIVTAALDPGISIPVPNTPVPITGVSFSNTKASFPATITYKNFGVDGKAFTTILIELGIVGDACAFPCPDPDDYVALFEWRNFKQYHQTGGSTSFGEFDNHRSFARGGVLSSSFLLEKGIDLNEKQEIKLLSSLWARIDTPIMGITPPGVLITSISFSFSIDLIVTYFTQQEPDLFAPTDPQKTVFVSASGVMLELDDDGRPILPPFTTETQDLWPITVRSSFQVMGNESLGTDDSTKQVRARLVDGTSGTDVKIGNDVPLGALGSLAPNTDIPLEFVIDPSAPPRDLDIDLVTLSEYLMYDVGKLSKDEIVFKSTRGSSNYYSIPPLGGRNTFTRFLEVAIAKTPDVSIDNVRLLLNTGGSQHEIVNQGIDGNIVRMGSFLPGEESRPGFVRNYKIILDPEDDIAESDEENNTTQREVFNDGQLLIVKMTFEDAASPVDTQPPPSNEISYVVQVSQEPPGPTAVSEVITELKQGLLLKPLWEAPPDTLSRSYGVEDEGGDKWSSKETYEWLLKNQNIIPGVNDISGEHAIDLGHKKHFTGNDIDTFHFANMGVTHGNGCTVYNKLRETVRRYIETRDDRALKEVAEWTMETRRELELLLKTRNVEKVIYGKGGVTCLRKGEKDFLLPGWMKKLLLRGEVTSLPQVQTRLPGIGVWIPGQVALKRKPWLVFRYDHNHHVHIALDFKN